ncbi:uncharacterized protein N7483_004371 [Penicillium malachiteum]|uniref:uncharacterized protein n=1 Tax=Penicillium malachiteum TaxID=1324776 RepID=UPI00254944D2|nr:uncharacterized protein N7483_004371 [Penicillium malachiteum]KAJ5729863.1 hypothetical protein N7483_004371 [Penicillium malachiteum]
MTLPSRIFVNYILESEVEMCGRYALGVRMAYVRQHLQDRGMPVDDAPEDDEVRETYNFAPGNFGAVYRAEIPDKERAHNEDRSGQNADHDLHEVTDDAEKTHTRYKIQSMKWGLIPSWTKRQPDYGSLMRTINCRDDSLMEDRGMWTSMKRGKRCIVVCQGFYEWLKKGPGGKDRIPHYVKRKDGAMMCFAGLWDRVSYEGTDEKLYTYTVITTSSNPYLKFLHERMPVILEPGSEAMKMWLDPHRKTWSKELQSILKPYEGELECYQVPKEVGKVGNNSPGFIVPVDSKENKSNIANFFPSTRKKDEKPSSTIDESPKKEPGISSPDIKPKKEEEETETIAAGVKREHSPESPTKRAQETKVQQGSHSPKKPKTRSATSNTPKKTGATKPTDGSQRITNFFEK